MKEKINKRQQHQPQKMNRSFVYQDRKLSGKLEGKLRREGLRRDGKRETEQKSRRRHHIASSRKDKQQTRETAIKTAVIITLYIKK